ncbi:MAG: prepilin-type N-terminal cleavage/methylation domain-containing protein [Opitutaceae bacterium]|nr:prepilin-type N-terminal cleavage/methylation domain-containing protein [Verrucomicrobiales bacterium]
MNIHRQIRPTCRQTLTRGFTLVELLVVIIILAALAAISFTVATRAKQQANSAKAVQSMRQIGSLVLGLASELGGKMPSEGHYPGQGPKDNPYTDDMSWDGAVLRYMGVTDVEASTPPRVPRSYESMFFHGNDDPTPVTGPLTPTAKRTFVYLRALSDIPVSQITDPTRTAMLSELPWANNRVGFKTISFMDPAALVKNPKSKRDLNPGGKFNFAFVDGHVSSMTVKESVGKGSTSGLASAKGVWTIDPLD